MTKVKENLLSWEFWLSVGIVAVSVGYLFWQLIWPKIQAATKRTALILITAFGLACALSNASASPVLETSPTMLAAQTAHFSSSLAVVTPEWQVLGLIIGIGIVALGFGWLSKRMQAGMGVAIGIFAVGISCVLAAPKVEQYITSLVMHAQAGIDSTNGFIRLVSPDGTNEVRWLTNGQVIRLDATGWRTGFTGFNIITNPAGGGYLTNVYADGLLTATNAPGSTVPTQL